MVGEYVDLKRLEDDEESYSEPNHDEILQQNQRDNSQLIHQLPPILVIVLISITRVPKLFPLLLTSSK